MLASILLVFVLMLSEFALILIIFVAMLRALEARTFVISAKIVGSMAVLAIA